MADLTLKRWLADIPHQFNALPNWEVLIKAFSEELDELYAVFEELNVLTCIDSATGKNLDMIGDIVNLTRHEAFNMLPDKSAGYANDEEYRACIKYQVIKLNSACTYEDLRNALALLLGEDNHIRYSEEAEHPATVVLEAGGDRWSQEARMLMNTPVLRAGGVGLLIRADVQEDIHYGTGITTQTAMEQTITLDTVDFKNDNNAMADEEGNYLADENWNLLVLNSGFLS